MSHRIPSYVQSRLSNSSHLQRNTRIRVCFPTIGQSQTFLPNKLYQQITTPKIECIHNQRLFGSLLPVNLTEVPPAAEVITHSEKLQSYPPPQPLRLVNRKTQIRKERKIFTNKILKDRSPWSHDWRVPLQALKQSHQDVNVQNQPENVTRGRWSMQNPTKIRQKHVEEIERPLIWTDLTFLNYIEDLTMSCVNWPMQRRLYGIGGSHAIAVADTLENLFMNVATKELLTPKACNLALLFFSKHHMASKIRALIVQMEKLHTFLEPESVNILLRSAAAQKDLHNFTFMLKRMLRQGFIPNAGTWIAFLMAVESGKARAAVIKCMRERGLLKQSSTLKDAVSLIIGDGVAKHLEEGKESTLFPSSLDLEYGTGWLSTSTANSMLYEVGQRNGVLEAITLLQILKDRGLVVDGVTLRTLLHLSSSEHNIDLVIKLLKLFQVEHDIMPEQDVYEYLLQLAWTRRLYNVARVIWRSACVKAATSFKMYHLVYRSLLCTNVALLSGRPKTRGQIWRESAGAVVAGIKPGGAFDQDFSLSNEAITKTLHTNGQTEIAALSRKDKKALLNSDLAAFENYRQTASLPELLSKAWMLDLEWKSSGAWKEKSAQWKRNNAIDVELKGLNAGPKCIRMVPGGGRP